MPADNNEGLNEDGLETLTFAISLWLRQLSVTVGMGVLSEVVPVNG
jgi:hypothetical protein